MEIIHSCVHGTLPTRLDRNTAILIDNIYFKWSPLFKNAEASILYTKMSAHFPYFLAKNCLTGMMTKKHALPKRINTKDALNGLLADLAFTKITFRLDLNPYADPDHNYDI